MKLIPRAASLANAAVGTRSVCILAFLAGCPAPKPTCFPVRDAGQSTDAGVTDGGLPISDAGLDAAETLVTLTISSNSTVYSAENVHLTAEVVPDVDVTKMEFFENGVSIDTETSVLFKQATTTAKIDQLGSYTFVAVATDKCGSKAASGEVTIVMSSPPDAGTQAEICAAASACTDCAARVGCGFCEANGQCVTSSGLEPAPGTCPSGSAFHWSEISCRPPDAGAGPSHVWIRNDYLADVVFSIEYTIIESCNNVLALEAQRITFGSAGAREFEIDTPFPRTITVRAKATTLGVDHYFRWDTPSSLDGSRITFAIDYDTALSKFYVSRSDANAWAYDVPAFAFGRTVGCP